MQIKLLFLMIINDKKEYKYKSIILNANQLLFPIFEKKIVESKYFLIPIFIPKRVLFFSN